MSSNVVSAPHQRRYRPEVQGLRALAVVLVVLYHVWLGRVSGGVDIFLLISAFLLTGSFVRKVEAGAPLALGRYWLHRFKGLLPAAVVVLLAVLAASAWLLPKSDWAGIFRQVWSSLFYVQNWTLANSSVDYYARDNSAASPLQHFWSLSVQGQVFILWPLIFAGAAFAANRLRLRYRHVLLGVFGAVFLCSLAFSIWQTAVNQGYAYFDTRTRLWEFALGSLLALALPYLRFGRIPRIIMGWIGVAAMLSCGVLLQVQQQFPGYMALWPTLAAALIITAGDTGSRAGADRFLSSKPLVAMGNNSYALYLWHWPVLVLWLVTAGKENAGLLDGAVVIALSCVLAVLTTSLVENPMSRWSWPNTAPWRTAVVVAASLALVAAPLAGWQAGVRSQEQAVRLQTVMDNPGALALDPGFEYAGSTDAVVKPSSTGMGAEWAKTDGACEEAYLPEDPLLAGCLRIGSAEGAVKSIVVLGDSHAQQWLSALGPVAKANNWHLVALLKPGCRYGAAAESRSEECNAFNAASSDYVQQTVPDAVFTVASVSKPSSAEETLADGYEAGVAPFTAAGIDVLAMRDNPRFDFDMVKCLDANNLDTTACTLPRTQLLAAVSPLDALAATPGIHTLDMTDQLCTAQECPGIIGNTFVYMDHDHLSRTYLETTTGVLARRILAATGWEGTAVSATTNELLE
ncbi:acyltransferase [Arthrobacter jiangjiafuii]|uniref:Acyltransferase n=1 Tax=Arthrobacter jiangjiafuii TaxID=2817475 RepID=A0A975M4I1_9MICC|nr:acyltransferase family protein [Arthrobacter jiangjiafuii]MBP3042863.1 acyltransferase [Arthrobacter jiangjiafuii]QWC09429.1 acyltransferase [Arthrobacter jiangjiafuii]